MQAYFFPEAIVVVSFIVGMMILLLICGCCKQSEKEKTEMKERLEELEKQVGEKEPLK